MILDSYMYVFKSIGLLALFLASGCGPSGDPYGPEKLQLVSSSYDVENLYRSTKKLPKYSDFDSLEADGIIHLLAESGNVEFVVFNKVEAGFLVRFRTDFYLIAESDLERLREANVHDASEFLESKRL